MDAKAYLKQVRYYDTQINCKLEERQRLMELATKVTSTLRSDAASGSSNQDKLGGAVAKIADLDSEINRDIDVFVDLKKEARTIVDQVKDATELSILLKHYFLYESLEQIACEINMAYRNVTRIHGRALLSVGEILKKNGKNQKLS